MGNRVNRRKSAGFIGLILLVCALPPLPAHAQLRNLYPGFFQLQNPEVLDVILYGGGYGSPKYGTIQEALQLEQTITPYFGIVGRVTGYQLWIGDDFANPLAPGKGHSGRLNFARLQAGGEFALYPG
ncbi:MAG TPA: hypothetical protein VJ728_03910, partial [Candidatus Binataceae bacterium]|nr:hypothetical protein [Candidatus Binataceae bacterium]